VGVLSAYLLLHGASSDSSYWYRVAPRLHALGHQVVAPDLPVSDDAAGLDEYAATALDAVGSAGDLVLVAHSMAGFTAPLVCDQVPVRQLVFLNAMVPVPGETPGAWWGNTGAPQARRAADLVAGRTIEGDFDPMVTFMHDLPEDVLRTVLAHGSTPQSDTPFASPCRFRRWPDVSIRYLLGRDDRFFPAEFQRRLAWERLGVVAEEMPGGHLCALSQPDELVELLVAPSLVGT
jgi:pimeloyl-ACP methyl ester carboxylesterase